MTTRPPAHTITRRKRHAVRTIFELRGFDINSGPSGCCSTRGDVAHLPCRDERSFRRVMTRSRRNGHVEKK